MIRKNKVKQLLKEGKTAIGTFIKTTDASAVEIMGMCGLDFFVIDSEHVSYNPETITDLVRVSDISGIVPIVRIKEGTPVNIMQALDLGALGFHAPNVDTFDHAKCVVESARYVPLGNRGFAPSHRAAGYGLMDKKEYIKMANEEILTILHCETMEAVSNLDQILTLPELDVIFIGPMDLSQSLGADVMGDRNHPKLLKTIDEIIDKVNAAGKAVGTVASDAKMAKVLMDKGVRYIPISSDQGMMADMAKAIVKDLSA
ncbi:MAG: aldolase/citrate lyase family protein [Eubacterium sp.]|nr:aldolase/citrate lyase family protein [Eubacterium sp.]